MYTLRRVVVGSAFKVMAILSGLVFAVVGFFAIFLPGIFGVGIWSMMAMSPRRLPFEIIGLRVLGSILLYLLGIVLYAVLGGIVGALYAAVYNLVAGIGGGLRVELDKEE
ncbi:MAG: hypothetical protein ACUVWB_11890 [Anaerolineae bacterium]